MRLTDEEKRKRLESIKEASKVFGTYKEICLYLDITYIQLKFALKGEPITLQIVEENLKKNKGETKKTKGDTKDKKNDKATKVKKKKNEKRKAAKKVKNSVEINAVETESETQKSKVLVDPSVVWLPNILQILDETYKDYTKVLLDTSIDQLWEIIENQDSVGENAKVILYMFAKGSNDYQVVHFESKSKENPILEYSKLNPDNTVLTAEIRIAAKIRGLKGSVKLLTESPFELQSLVEQIKQFRQYPIVTLPNIKKVGNCVFLEEYRPEERRFFIISDKKIIIQNHYKLKIGDEVYFFKQSVEETITLTKFRVTSLKEESNANMLWGKRLDEKDLDKTYEDYRTLFEIFMN